MVASITVEKNAYGVVTFNCAEKEVILTSDIVQRHLASCGIKKDDSKNPFSLLVLGKIQRIDEDAFAEYCLEHVDLSHSSVKEIGNRSFQRCRFLKSVTIPAGVESIGESAFALCPRLESFSIDDQNTHFVFSEGAVYNKDKSFLFFVLGGYRGRQFTLPSSVLEIKDCAFVGCRRVERVVCNKLINKIGDFAFDNHHIKIIVLPDKELDLGEDVFCPETEILRVPPKLFDSIDIRFLRFKK